MFDTNAHDQQLHIWKLKAQTQIVRTRKTTVLITCAARGQTYDLEIYRPGRHELNEVAICSIRVKVHAPFPVNRWSPKRMKPTPPYVGLDEGAIRRPLHEPSINTLPHWNSMLRHVILTQHGR